DKMARRGMRFSDFAPRMCGSFRERLSQVVEEKNFLMRNHFQSDEPGFDLEQISREYCDYYEQLKPYLADTPAFLNQTLQKGQTVLFEGAQGTGLDVDHGTYPFVTSSNTTAGGACTGTGVGPVHINKVIGITKAYTTRVGEGPMPTELAGDPIGQLLQETGKEFGATTGRIRRCGWFDAVIVRQAMHLNSLTALAVTKLDVLDKLDTIKIATGYRDDEGNIHQRIPTWMGVEGTRLEPVYEELPGWDRPVQGVLRLEDLPSNARAYLDRIAELVGAPVAMISTGPRREETIVLDGLL
ncbi:MAG: adenylosuccinate synthetase, partial [Deltaproteobacteria bacterium]|nr:adenylosuccinate synthetase [Deltaproteobacteria bacterium]